MSKKEAKKQRRREVRTVAQTQKDSLHPFLASLFPFLCGLFKLKSTPNDLKKMDFSISTQRLGISFTDKVRNIFRHKWLRKSD
ncbi:MAG: hypothetical protein WCW64_03365 [Phycisphaerae bacterium]|jgi:hypothetical protein